MPGSSTDRPETADRGGRADRVETSDRSEIADRPEAADRPETAGRLRGPVVPAAAAFLAVLAGLLAAVQAMPTRYAATSVVSFVPRPESAAAADTVQLVGEKYVVLARAPAVLETAGAA